MHQAAFPGEDISDRPEPETVVPAAAAAARRAAAESGRYRAADWRRCGAGVVTTFVLPDELDGDRHRRPQRDERAAARRARRAASSTAASTDSATSSRPGDLVVVNTSGDAAAAVDGDRADGTRGDRALRDRARRRRRGSSRSGRAATADGPVPDAAAGERFTLPDGVDAAPRRAAPGRSAPAVAGARRRRRRASPAYLARHGRPIRYALRAAGVPARRLPDRLRPRARAAPRCRAPAGRSPPSWSPSWSPAASASHRSRCTPASRRRRPASRRSPSGYRVPASDGARR